MKKRLVSLIMCIAVVLSFTSCGSDDDNIVSDSNVFNPDTSTTETLLADNADTNSDTTVKITVPEGYTLLKTAWLLEENGVCTTDAFLSATQNYDMSKYSILSSLSTAENICFRLEGYLFPATYNFEKNSDPNEVIKAMVSATESRFTQSMRARAAELGYSVHEILTIASIIEKEAFTQEQRTLISSTLYNRLNKKMQLQCDVTTKYCTGVIELQYPDKIDTYKYFYNTYRCAALPAGPICNPGISSINAALNPDSTDYLYFVIDTDPPYESAFSATYEEHLKNCERMGY